MFKVTKFEKNSDADTACDELFLKIKSKKTNKVKTGKIIKKTKVEDITCKNEEKLKEEIRTILQNGFDSIQPIKTKRTKNKQKIIDEDSKWKKDGERKVKKESIVEQDTAIKTKKKKRKRENKNLESTQDTAEVNSSSLENADSVLNAKKKKTEKLKEKLQQALTTPHHKQKTKNLSLRERMMARVQAAKFRFINEQIYSVDSKEAQKIFQDDPETFTAYHEGYRQQVKKWPLNPVDAIIKNIQRLPKNHIIADFGCGEAKLAKSVEQKVHSFDLVALNDSVTQCDMAHVPLAAASVDVVVFCLSLMGTNLHDYLLEANRVLKIGGILKIAEVESRFDDVANFIEAVERFHFKNTWKDFSHNLFYFLDFKKESNIKNKKKLPSLSLHPCLYKKR